MPRLPSLLGRAKKGDRDARIQGLSREILESKEEDKLGVLDLNRELLKAAADGDQSKVIWLLDKGVSIEVMDVVGRYTPLHFACSNGHVDVVKMLLARGANIKATDKDGWTPLHNTCLNGHVEVVGMLLARGSNIEATNEDGWTSLHRACAGGHVDVVKMLLVGGANIKATDKDGETPLHTACYWGKIDVVECLLAKGANMEAPRFDGSTPLHFACCEGHVNVVEILLAKGAYRDARNNNGKTPLDIAKSKHHESIVKILTTPPSANGDGNQKLKGLNDTRDNRSRLVSVVQINKDPPCLDKTSQHCLDQIDPCMAVTFGNYDEIRSKLNAMIENLGAQLPLKLPQAYIQEIKTNTKLGGGFFGEVHLGEDKVIRKKFAIKLINPLVIDDAFASRIGSIQKSFQTEIKVLSQLKHPNIAQLYGYCMEGDHLENTCLVYELATNGSLDKFWENDLGRSRISDEKVRTRIALEVATALRYMHQGLDGGEVCYHRDIKSGNICLAADLSSRIIDCGLSKFVTESDGSVSSTGPSGTPGYICPLYSQGIISFCSACDVFSFGVLLCELITGKTNSRQTPHYVNYKIKKGILVDDADKCVSWGESSCLERLSNLALECMGLDVSSRPSIGDLVEELGDILRQNKQHHKKESNSVVPTKQSLIKCRSCGLDSSSDTIIHCFGSQKHYHCHNCFENHITKKMNSFKYDLTCPKEGCNSREFLDTEVAKMISSNVWVLYLNQSKMINLFHDLERRLTNKVESECRQVKDLQAQLCAGNGLPCPRRFVLVAADRHGKLLRNPHEWAKNLVSIKLYIYFVCSHSQEMVSDDARIKVRYSPDWLKKIAPALNASLALIKVSSKTCIGKTLSLDLFAIQELDEWSKDLMDPDDRKLIEDARQSGKYHHVKELNQKSLSYVSEKIETNRTWLNEMVPVYDSKDKIPTFVLTKYAHLCRYGGNLRQQHSSLDSA